MKVPNPYWGHWPPGIHGRAVHKPPHVSAGNVAHTHSISMSGRIGQQGDVVVSSSIPNSFFTPRLVFVEAADRWCSWIALRFL